MIPSIFVFLDALPLSLNGKIDDKALPDPDFSAERTTPFTAAQTPVEETLVDLWDEVLKAGRIGIHDNFFDLGGHSLMAVQIVSRIQQAFPIEIPQIYLFEHPTIAELADYIEQRLRDESSDRPLAPPITSIPRDEALPLSFAQDDFWFMDQIEPGNVSHNMPRILYFSGELNTAALEQSFQTIIQRHEVLRANFSTIDGTPQAIIRPAESWALGFADLQHLPIAERQEEARRLTTECCLQPLELEKDWLCQAILIQLDATEYLFVVVMHHIISDGWSFNIFFRELQALYTAFVDDQPSPLMDLPVQYVDYAYWQREWLQHEVFNQQMDYWKEQLIGPLPILELPTDHPRTTRPSSAGGISSLMISSDLTHALKQLSRQTHITLFQVLLTARTILLSVPR
jgi:acyl carrier protein